MKDVLPVPVAEARKYLNGKNFEKYKECFDSFYGPDPSYSLLDITLRMFLPKDCEAAKDLAMKRYQLRVRDSNVDINQKIESLKSTSEPKLRSLLTEFILGAERGKEAARKEAREYGVEIPV